MAPLCSEPTAFLLFRYEKKKKKLPVSIPNIITEQPAQYESRREMHDL